jgi:hypothetical protein
MKGIIGKWADQNAPAFVVFGALVLGMLGAGLYDKAKQWLGLDKVIVLLLLIVVLFPLVSRFVGEHLLRYVQIRIKVRAKPSFVIEDIRKVERRRQALVAISSSGPQKATEPVVKFHYRGEDGSLEPVLRYCWLICGPGEGQFSSQANAVDIKRTYSEVEVFVEPVADADDPKQVFEVVQRIYAEAEAKEIPRSEIIADYTAGTKSMTAGLVLACTEQDKDLQYMKPRRYTADGRADPTAGSDPIAVGTSFFLEFGQEQSPRTWVSSPAESTPLDT